jgi:predicted CopG family antitoxin
MIRTIKIDVDAFERLDRARRNDETLSQVIRRCVPERRSHGEISTILSKPPFSEEFLDTVDKSMTRRRRIGRKRQA